MTGLEPQDDSQSWLVERVRLARAHMIEELRRLGPGHIGTATRLLLGIERKPCEACDGTGQVWIIPEGVQREVEAL